MQSKCPATGNRPLRLEEIGYVSGFPIEEHETPTERKEQVMHAIDEAMQYLRSVLSRDPVGSQKLDRTYPQATEQLKKGLEYLLQGLERMSCNAQQFLSNVQLPEDRVAVVQASMDLLALSEAEVSWRAQAMEHWGNILEMDVALKKCKLMEPQRDTSLIALTSGSESNPEPDLSLIWTHSTRTEGHSCNRYEPTISSAQVSLPVSTQTTSTLRKFLNRPEAQKLQQLLCKILRWKGS